MKLSTSMLRNLNDTLRLLKSQVNSASSSYKKDGMVESTLNSVSLSIEDDNSLHISFELSKVIERLLGCFEIRSICMVSVAADSIKRHTTRLLSEVTQLLSVSNATAEGASRVVEMEATAHDAAELKAKEGPKKRAIHDAAVNAAGAVSLLIYQIK